MKVHFNKGSKFHVGSRLVQAQEDLSVDGSMSIEAFSELLDRWLNAGKVKEVDNPKTNEHGQFS